MVRLHARSYYGRDRICETLPGTIEHVSFDSGARQQIQAATLTTVFATSLGCLAFVTLHDAVELCCECALHFQRVPLSAGYPANVGAVEF